MRKISTGFFLISAIALSHTTPAFSITSPPQNALPLHRCRQRFGSPVRCSNEQSQLYVTSWLFCLFLYQVHPVLKRCSWFLFKDNQPVPKSPSALVKNAFEKKEYYKKMRNENEIILAFRCLSWHRSLLLRELSLMRGQLPSSFLYLTWLSLPFQCFLIYRGICH
jgi:hypothetical protein